jgi:hypothetical protein
MAATAPAPVLKKLRRETLRLWFIFRSHAESSAFKKMTFYGPWRAAIREEMPLPGRAISILYSTRIYSAEPGPVKAPAVPGPMVCWSRKGKTLPSVPSCMGDSMRNAGAKKSFATRLAYMLQSVTL